MLIKVLAAEVAEAMCHRWHLARIHLLPLPLIVLLLAGCGAQPASVPILDQCPLPCWAGITPGETTRTEVHDILIARYGEENVSTDPTRTIDWTAPQPDEMVGSGYISFERHVGEDDVVDTITLQIQDGNLTVGQLIAKIGNPGEATVRDGHPDSGECIVTLLNFPSIGVVAFLNEADGTGSVTDSQYVEHISIHPPGRYVGFTESYTVKWRGYDRYCQGKGSTTRSETTIMQLLLPPLLGLAGLASLLGVAYLQFRIMRQRLTINRRTLIAFVTAVLGSFGLMAIVSPEPKGLLVYSGILIPLWMIMALSIWLNDRAIVGRIPVYMERARKARMEGHVWIAEVWENRIRWLCDRYVEAEALRSKKDEEDRLARSREKSNKK